MFLRLRLSGYVQSIVDILVANYSLQVRDRFLRNAIVDSENLVIPAVIIGKMNALSFALKCV